ncbi:MAG TPA: DegT/DnrJ/EryC1/StrS family aminotransferase [Longimicrobiales bacterium]|nr:DegT/DnrJ/EryC1/StrS family aminotransferase [Longimicrobiales bacterium]
MHEELRSYLKQRFAADDVLLYSSGTHALTVAIDATLPVGSPRIVALPGFACFDLATAAIGAGATVLLYDVDPATLGPDWDSFDSALAAGASAAVVAPLFGLPIDWERAEAIAQRHGVALIEDAAQAAGGAWKGRPIGSLGEMSVLSFGRGKGWTGSGGGALLLRGSRGARAGMKQQMMDASARDSLRAFVKACAQMLLSHPLVYGVPASMPFLHLGETRYKEPASVRGMSRFSAALALETAECSRVERGRRAQWAAKYAAQLADVASIQTFDAALDASSTGGWVRYPLLTTRAIRTHLLTELGRDGLAASYPIPLRSLPEMQPHLAWTSVETPGSDMLADGLLTLPTHAHAPTDIGSLLEGHFVAKN